MRGRVEKRGACEDEHLNKKKKHYTLTYEKEEDGKLGNEKRRSRGKESKTDQQAQTAKNASRWETEIESGLQKNLSQQETRVFIPLIFIRRAR